jgi:hypothetical protein
VSDTLGLLEEARQLASDLGYHVREEPLGDMPGGVCSVGGVCHVLLNLQHSTADRLDCLLRTLADDSRLSGEPMSRLLAARLKGLARGGSDAGTARDAVNRRGTGRGS